MASPVTYLLCACGIVALVLLRQRNKSSLPLPPGPPADPIIGHLRIFSPARQHELFPKWAAEYGDIFHLGILGQNLIVMNSLQVATDLLEKRSSKHSDRPACTTLELMGWEASLPLLLYGPRWKKHRKMFQQYFNYHECLAYYPSQLREARVLAKSLMITPKDFLAHTQRFALSSLIRITYGHQAHSDDDIYVNIIGEVLRSVEAATAGVALIDLFPSLRYVPHWLPGMSSLTAMSRRWHPTIRHFHNWTFDDVLRQMDAGIAQPSFLASHLERLDLAGTSSEDLEDIKGSAASILIAGSETTWSLIQTLFFAMLVFPGAQHKAQEEIDKVIGCERLPDFSDRDSLPFVECVLQEIIRWYPVLPWGVPHRSLDDDVYNGMFIPKGSVMIPNVLAMSHDQQIYKNPEIFCPERFLPVPAGHGEPHLDVAFGFGRRICPGRYFADNSAWLVLVTVLATLNISKVVGQDGRVVEPKVEFTTESQVSRPRPFDCVFQPRSEAAKALILQQSE
ncbi:Multifunctional cytochrome P450 monooxygenase af510 [Sparassis crispa]|uniref:Multifunctional cytochrome P450 monooxygenase af510 n=1 Tax=Sparassis crispa TaxID=139825 RepID=A0A401H5I8_9APHY|nr:Multifunctional cytochrome P450 monooxygenase af510 [Sparassis crispa]GBE89649.1 Multifunctional cytochrome P450 monooxygenase af510 [Sparassis crispa]